MALPATVPVKLSSEAAEYVSLSPVVAREMPFLEFFEHVVAATGPDADRIGQILRRGSIVSGATRFRWQGFDADAGEIRTMLAQLPGPEPDRAFDPEQCAAAFLCGPGHRIELSREAGGQRRLFRRRSFWELLVETAQPPVYVTYAARERADIYRSELDARGTALMREAAGLLRYHSLSSEIRAARITTVEWIVPRGLTSARAGS